MKSCESWELPESKKQREPKKQGKPKKQAKPKYLSEPWDRSKPLEPGAQEKLSKWEMQWKPEMLAVQLLHW